MVEAQFPVLELRIKPAFPRILSTSLSSSPDHAPTCYRTFSNLFETFIPMSS